MPLRLGTARQIANAITVVNGLVAALSISTAAPGLVHVLLPLVFAASERAKALQSRKLQSWPVELSRREVDVAREAAFPHVFYCCFGLSPEDFHQLHDAFDLPQRIRTRCKKACTSQTALLVLLARLRSSSSLETLGRSIRMNPKRISAVCTTTVGWLYGRWGHLPSLISAFASRFPLYDRAIAEASGIDNLHVMGFLDCTVRGTSRPLYGQEAVYNGHKKKHGLKYQATGFPDGLLQGLYGPIQSRRHDSRVLVDSGLQQTLETCQQQSGVQWLIYADAAYNNTQTIMSGFDRVQRANNQEMEWLTKSYNAQRTSVEWCFGKVSSKFKWLESRDANCIGKTSCGMYYLVAVLLTNCITCLEGGNIHYSRFRCTPPSLQEYLAM